MEFSLQRMRMETIVNMDRILKNYILWVKVLSTFMIFTLKIRPPYEKYKGDT